MFLLFSYACVCASEWRASYVFWCACGYVCVRTWLVYVRTCTRLHMWMLTKILHRFVHSGMRGMHGLSTRSRSWMAVRRTHGISAWSQPISVQSEICHRCTAVSNLVCIVSCVSQIDAVDFLIKFHLLMVHYCSKDNCFLFFLFIFCSFLMYSSFVLF